MKKDVIHKLSYLASFICFLLIFSCETNVEQEEIETEACSEVVLYQSAIRPIIEGVCIECHNGSQLPDFRTFEAVQQNALKIKQQVVARTMPQVGTLSNTEIEAISCWVDQGAKNN